MVLRKFSEITNNKPIFSQYNIFYNYEYFFFQSAFWSLFNHRQRSQSNQEQCSLCCGSPCFRVLLCTHYGPLQCFSTYFRKLKEIGVLQPIFPDYVISCNYVYKNIFTQFPVLKELRNCILLIILACSLFGLIRVNLGLHFLQFLFKNQFFVFLCFLRFLFWVKCFEPRY